MAHKQLCRPSAESVIATTATWKQVLSPDNDRTAVTFSASGNTVYVSSNPNQTGSNGIQVLTSTNPVELCQCHQGDWVKRAIFAASPGGAATLVIIEGFEPWPENEMRW